ncbi:hypothetical protein DVJ77_15270 [Dyella tabacisoli]|uniref:Uncharacterized protein n=2 Tax=Dyella tabacisoli TaxID=2282381 RepID=A0A369UL53_9GAMM|nr:hypothetical protein DVJ77_15270 [Dyella tabacisoli]
MALWPGASGKVRKPRSALTILYTLGHALKLMGLPEDGAFWSRIDRPQARKLLGKPGVNSLNTVAFYYGMGALPDGPSTAKRKGIQSRRDRLGEPEHSECPDNAKQWQPFPDTYTAEAGWRAVHMMSIVGPTLIDAIETAAFVPVRTTRADGAPLSKRSIQLIKKQAFDNVISTWDWRAPDGSALQDLPMPIHSRSQRSLEHSQPISWPPRSYFEAFSLLVILQSCHLWIVALSFASRHGELLSLRENCLRRETSDISTASLSTWKLDGIVGRSHEVPLPDIVVATLRQQVRLAKLAKRIANFDGDHLWVRLDTRGSPEERIGSPITNFARYLQGFNFAFDLTPLLENTNAHMHRFRKTLARIVALALVHAPKILMDVLGHRDEQMTVMRYILSDPGILVEIEEISRELIILKGVDAVGKLEQLQGKAARTLRERVAQHVKRLGKNALEPQNLREFVEAMTEHGAGWAIIGPGKVCTGFKKGGLCNDINGEANPHYCSTDCHNQLLLPDYERADGTFASSIVEAIDTIDYVVDHFLKSEKRGEEMLVAALSGQIRGLLGQWREVDQHFQNRHLLNPEVKKHFLQVVLLS